jgi:uncharacterized membrane protein YfcA
MLILNEALLLLFTALTIGVIGNLVGIGGGVLIMIVLLFVFKVSPVVASGMSLTTIFVSTTVGTMLNIRQEAVSRGIFGTIALFAGVGVIAGSVTSYFISTKPFDFLFGFVSVGIGIYSVAATRRDKKPSNLDYSFSSLSKERKGETKNIADRSGIWYMSAIAGYIAGLFGIGIGGIVGTYLTAIKKINPKVAFSSVLAAMIVTSLAGSLLHFFKTSGGYNLVLFTLALVVGASIGAALGALISARIVSSRLRFMQGYIIISLGILALLSSILTS